MKITKCGCSNSIHIFYSAENMTCPFCNARVNILADKSYGYNEPFSFLNDKLSEIDRQIGTSKYVSAKNIIKEVLEVAPGLRIGDLPNSGEVHWRKLLADVGCRNDMELLTKGRLLRHYTAFTNAEKYATDEERLVYTSIEEKKILLLAEMQRVLEKQELDKKRETGAEKLLGEYKQELDALTKRVQDGISRLENVERAIHEQVADYMAVIGEYKHSISTICSKARGVGNRNNEISIEQKNSWIAELEANLSKCNQEANALKKVESSDEHFQAYNRLIDEQRTIVSEIKGNISKINDLRSKIEELLAKIGQISAEYGEAVIALKDGNYSPAKKLIPQPRLDDLIKQIMTAKPSQRGSS